MNLTTKAEASGFKGGRIEFAICRDDSMQRKGTPGCRGCVKLRIGQYGCKASFEHFFRDAGDPRVFSCDEGFEKVLLEEAERAKHKDAAKGPRSEPNAKAAKAAKLMASS